MGEMEKKSFADTSAACGEVVYYQLIIIAFHVTSAWNVRKEMLEYNLVTGEIVSAKATSGTISFYVYGKLWTKKR
jgi:hypothetical protein